MIRWAIGGSLEGLAQRKAAKASQEQARRQAMIEREANTVDRKTPIPQVDAQPFAKTQKVL